MDGKPDPVSVKSLKSNIAALGTIDLNKVQELIDKKDWSRAINALDAISAQAKKVQSTAGRMASRAAKQHCSPLLEDTADG